jgi:hypothetical protein
VQGLCTYTAVGVDAAGLVSADDVVAALTPNTVLVTIMHSNNEVRGRFPTGTASLMLTVLQMHPLMGRHVTDCR